MRYFCDTLVAARTTRRELLKGMPRRDEYFAAIVNYQFSLFVLDVFDRYCKAHIRNWYITGGAVGHTHWRQFRRELYRCHVFVDSNFFLVITDHINK